MWGRVEIEHGRDERSAFASLWAAWAGILPVRSGKLRFEVRCGWV